jgi:S1-C subfamily serine protease
MRAAFLAFAVAVSWSVSAAAEPASRPAKRVAKPDVTRILLAQRDRVARATVVLPEKSCAGSVAGDREHVVTAAHCVLDDATSVRVRFSEGTNVTSSIAHIDRDADIALLRLEAPAPTTIEPLPLSSVLPQRGSRVLFVGRTDRPSRTQVVRVERLGRCPSIPGQRQALFTSVQARPGDSGAPLLHPELGVVGVIHGGAACHIAAPTASLAKALAVDQTSPRPSAPDPAPIAPSPDADAGDDGWFFERTGKGFRFRWNFRWGTSR